MSPELDAKLCGDYPLIFANRTADPGSTLMCWGFDHGDGWYLLIDRLCRHIQHHIDSAARQGRTVPQVVAVQVKEKFGTLRFYADGGDEFTRSAIWFAEALSGDICEVCGDPGERRNTGWIRTLCDTHANTGES